MPKFKKKVYLKDESFDPIYHPVNYRFAAKTRVLPVALPVLGLLLLGSQVILPLVTFQTQDKNTEVLEASALGYVSGFKEFKFEELKAEAGDESRVLGKSTFGAENINHEKYFTITIPRLRIEKALVEINEPTLVPDEALGHYSGSALPGEAGNSFIYGHSVLPFFYNPKNYKTIFSTLNQLQQGDEFSVEYKGKTFTYKVADKRQLKPDQVDPLGGFRPKYLNEPTMTLMTCSPPGTKLYRLMVDAVLVDD